MCSDRIAAVRHPDKVERWPGRIPNDFRPGGISYATRRKGGHLRGQKDFIFSNEADRRVHAGVNGLVGTKQLSCTKVRMDVVVRIVWKSRERNGYMHGGVKRKIWASMCEW